MICQCKERLRRGDRGSARRPGTRHHYDCCVPAPASTSDWVAITADPLPLAAATEWATTPGSGAVVSFLGVVRDHSEGRDGVQAIDYEAYELSLIHI